MSYESDCLTFVDSTYRPMKETGAHPGWPAAPAIGTSGNGCATWIDADAGSVAPDGYRVWQAAQPTQSGGNSPPPPPPTGGNN